MATPSSESPSSASTGMALQRRDLVAAALVLVLGIAAVVGLGMTRMDAPGVLPQDTAFLVLGGAVLALVPATFMLMYAAKENRRRLAEHERIAWAQFETLEDTGEQAARTEELASRVDDLVVTTHETNRVQENTKERIERIESMLEDDRRTIARLDDRVRAAVGDGQGDVEEVEAQLDEIAERQETMFSEMLSRQEQVFDKQEETLRRTIEMEEERLTSLLDRQEKLLEAQERSTSNGQGTSRGRSMEEGASEFPRTGLVTARSLVEADPMETESMHAETEPGSSGQPESVNVGPIEHQLEMQTRLLEDLVGSIASASEPEGSEVKREAPSRGAIIEERPRYPVAKYEIEEIPSVGAAASRKLGAVGVNLTDTLLHTDLDRLAEATGIDREQLGDWRATAELMSLDGMGPELSARLVSVGVTRIDELARLDPDELSDLLLETYDDEESDSEVLTRTLPRRSEKIIDRARSAAMRLQPHEAA